MSRIALSSFLVLCVLFTVFPLGFKMSARASSSTIYVPTDYSTIQGAVNAAPDGATIYVYNGTYNENVVVNKTVSLIGESEENAIITAANSSINAVNITSYNVNISGFSVTGATGYFPAACGFYLNDVNNVVLSHNHVTNDTYGICIDSSNNNTIANNTVDSNYWGIALEINDSYNTIVGNNASSNTYYGIIVWSYSKNNIIANNTVTNNHPGITLGYSDNNTIEYNDISRNSMGIEIQEVSNNNTIFQNNIVNNTDETGGNSMNESMNLWDNGYPSGGNYWSDYNGTDANQDGIGDTPYVINANNTDHYPLMVPTLIPEFPSFLILPLFFIPGLLAVTVYRKKRTYKDSRKSDRSIASSNTLRVLARAKLRSTRPILSGVHRRTSGTIGQPISDG